MTKIFRPHQKEGFERYKDQDEAAFLMEMRLGKTLLAIRWVNHRWEFLPQESKNDKKLVLAPKTPINSWLDELEDEGEKALVIEGNPKQREQLLLNDFWDHDWILCTFGMFVKTPKLWEYPISSLLVDESSSIKNARTTLCKLITKFSRRVRIKGILTGTVRPEKDDEIYPQMNVPFSNFMGYRDFWKWRQKYFSHFGYDWVAPPKNRQLIKDEVQRLAYIKERKDANVGTEPIHVTRMGHLYNKAAEVYRHIAKDWEYEGHETKYATQRVNWLRKVCTGKVLDKEFGCWKFDDLIHLLTGDLHGEQLVIWFAYKSELRRVFKFLKSKGYKATYIHGDVDRETRRKRVKNFANGYRQIFLSTINCGKYSLNLSNADTAIYFSKVHSYEAYYQSIARIQHMCKDRPLLIISMVSENTVEEIIEEKLKLKESSMAWFLRKVDQHLDPENKRKKTRLRKLKNENKKKISEFSQKQSKIQRSKTK